MLEIECTRYRVQQGKSEKVTEWLKFLNDNMKDVLVTLEGEKMYVETIFREVWNNEEYLYWYAVQETGGNAVEDSTHWIDKKHLDYWDECIDPTFIPVNLSTEVVMIPEKIKVNMI